MLIKAELTSYIHVHYVQQYTSKPMKYDGDDGVL